MPSARTILLVADATRAVPTMGAIAARTAANLVRVDVEVGGRAEVVQV